MQKVVYRNNEVFKAAIEIAHFGDKPLEKAEIICQIINEKGEILHKEIFTKERINIGNCIETGLYQMDLSEFKNPVKLTLEVFLLDTLYKNRWDFWVYPAKQSINPGNVLITDKLDSKSVDVLKKGGSVLLLTYGKVGKEKGAQVAIGFSSIFWNTAWTNNQAPHTLGILCDPKHPLFNDFPTEYHTNWQWWDPVSHSQAMILDGFEAKLKPIIQPIDTWFENRRLALAFEAKTNGGKLMVCSIDLKDISEDRIVSKQLLSSLLNYMNSKSFDPKIELETAKVKELTDNTGH
jgi:hypothetical protein